MISSNQYQKVQISLVKVNHLFVLFVNGIFEHDAF